MAKLPTKNPNEDLIWATAYSIAIAMIVLAESRPTWSTDEKFAEYVDKRAAAVADKAAKRLKGRIQ